MEKNQSVLIMAAIPPPYGGGEIMSKILLENLKSDNNFHFHHLNTSDNRGNSNRGKFDAINILNGIVNLFRMIWLIKLLNPVILYLPISKTYRGFFRDALYINFASLLGVKVVAHLHGGYFTLAEGKGIKQKIVKYTLDNIHTLIVLGYGLKKKFEHKLTIRNIEVVYNGIQNLV